MLLGAAMKQADVRIDPLHHLAVEFKHEAQDAVRGRMLGAEIPPMWMAGLIAPPIWADSAVGIMRIAATTPIIESLPSIRLLLAHYPFNSLHDWHFEIVFIVAIICQLIHILLEAL